MLTAFVILLVLVPLLPLLPHSHWSIRFFDFVRLQTLTLQIALLFVAIYVWNEPTSIQRIYLVALLSCAIYQAILILPYTHLSRHRVPMQSFNHERLKLVTANVLQTNTDYDSFIKEIKKSRPHIFVTMESDAKWDCNVSKAFPEYSYTTKVSLNNFYGMHLYAKIPFETSEIKYLVEDDIPSIHTTLLFNKTKIKLITIHPAPPSPTENETSKERDAELMIVGEMCRETDDATVVCGDLNDVVWSKTSRLFKKMTGFLDPRVGRGLYPTFHAKYWLLRFPLDHLFYSKDLHVPVLKRLKPFGSDHFAMYYEIATPEYKVSTDSPQLSQNEHREINEIIDQGIEAGKK